MHTILKILPIVFVVVAVISSLVAVAWLSELRRRRKWDKAGFADFVRAGAPLINKEFLDAFKNAPFRKELAQVSVHKPCKLHLGSGKLGVGDPAFVSKNKDIFDQKIPPGDYPVEVLVGRKDDADQRCFAIRVVFSENSECRLEPAWTPRSRERAIKERNLPGFGVDTGTACIYAAEAIPHVTEYTIQLYRKSKEGAHVNRYLSDKPEGLWDIIRIGEEIQGINTSSGLGDGSYYCYFSFDDQKNPVALYVDFCFFDEPQWDWVTKP